MTPSGSHTVEAEYLSGQSSQFSNFSPGTFSKSRRLAVSSRASAARAQQAILRSEVVTRRQSGRSRSKCAAAASSKDKMS